MVETLTPAMKFPSSQHAPNPMHALCLLCGCGHDQLPDQRLKLVRAEQHGEEDAGIHNLLARRVQHAAVVARAGVRVAKDLCKSKRKSDEGSESPRRVMKEASVPVAKDLHQSRAKRSSGGEGSGLAWPVLGVHAGQV